MIARLPLSLRPTSAARSLPVPKLSSRVKVVGTRRVHSPHRHAWEDGGPDAQTEEAFSTPTMERVLGDTRWISGIVALQKRLRVSGQTLHRYGIRIQEARHKAYCSCTRKLSHAKYVIIALVVAGGYPCCRRMYEELGGSWFVGALSPVRELSIVPRARHVRSSWRSRSIASGAHQVANCILDIVYGRTRTNEGRQLSSIAG